MKYIVVGTGRSGTGFMSKLLSLNGIDCGHESVIDRSMNKQQVYDSINYTKYAAESSWLAVPYIDFIASNFPEIKFIQVKRNPYKVVKSFYRIDFFNPNRDKLTNRLVKETIDIKGLDSVDCAVRYYYEWHKMIRNKLPKNRSFVVDIDDIDYYGLEKFLGTKITKFDEVINTKPNEMVRDVSDESIVELVNKSKYFKKLSTEARRHGYLL